MSSGYEVGNLVEYVGGPGIGRIGALDEDSVRIDFFESIAKPAAESLHVPTANCRRARLEPETRVYWRNPSTAVWLSGRVKGERLPQYFVQFPNSEYDFPVDERDLRVRWDRPVRDPLQVLTTGGNESGYLHDARLPMLHSLVAQRAASASTAALLSSAVEIYPHQVRAALTVLSDPVQRYLLADEVGLGKTIEAGYVIRQTLIDNPGARVTVLTPDTLRRQWAIELHDKFFTSDFPLARVKIISHEAPERWAQYHDSDLVVVDEAHWLVEESGPGRSPYQELAELAHAAPKLLLLSATPVTSHYTTHLGLLHLLEPDIYRWDAREAFEYRYALRSELADSVYGLDASFAFLLPSTIDRIRELLPSDSRFEHLATQVLQHLDEDDDLRDEAESADLAIQVEGLRAHISETYRLHRRVIRHRRAQVLREDKGSDLEPYEVRGRDIPDALDPKSLNQAVQDLLLDWRTRVWDQLLDQELDSAQGIYALALGVLVSRSSGPADDLADALRWRVRGDNEAAKRACLSTQERRHLADPPLLDHESMLLDALEAQLAGAEPEADLKALIETLLPVLRQGGRLVIFCGPGSLAGRLASRLRFQFQKASIGEHTRDAGSEASERAVTAWRAHADKVPTRVLIVDDTAEDGLNLQIANAVVHLRLPWSPNRLEQRLGRVDRYRGAESADQRTPARQYVLGAPGDVESLSGAWLVVLSKGYQVFSESVSTLQDAIAQGLGRVWGGALQDGPEGLVASVDRVHGKLSEARREIDKMDLLESIHETTSHGRNIAAALGEIEQQWHGTRDALLNYAGDGSSGIKLRHFARTTDGCKREVFDLSSSHPLIAPRLYQSKKAQLTSEMTQGAFNRSAVLRAPGTRLFRLGNPLVDMLASVIAIDDRGQATAFRRIDPGYTGEPEPYFGFDFLVEADVATAATLAGDHAEVKIALRRQADRILPPLTRKVWIPAGADQALTNAAACAWLEAPYDNRRDHNYNMKLIRDLTELFGGWAAYGTSAQAAENTARKHLEQAANLASVCSQAQETARQHLAVARAQAEARQAAGRLVGDTESFLLDVAVTDALVESLTHPNVRVVAATCIVRSGYERVERHG